MNEPVDLTRRLKVTKMVEADETMALEQLIEAYFKKEGLNQSEIGRRIGVNSSVLSRYFRGENEVRAQVFVQLFELMGINLKELLLQKLVEPPEQEPAPQNLGGHIERLIGSVDPLTKMAILSSLIATLEGVGSTRERIGNSPDLQASFQKLCEEKEATKTVHRKWSV